VKNKERISQRKKEWNNFLFLFFSNFFEDAPFFFPLPLFTFSLIYFLDKIIKLKNILFAQPDIF